MRTRLSIITLLAAAAVGLFALTASAAAPKLVGTVGPGFTITLTRAGHLVKTLMPGRYAITVRDLSSIHNFHLLGPGVNKTTQVTATGTNHWTVTLKRGVYTYMCDPHRSFMRGTFTVK